MSGFSQWLGQLDLSALLNIVISVAASLLCITVHETCHGLAALWMGDDTAKRQGRLSLNPLRHVDLMGLVMMALLRFGWARAVPVNPAKFRRPKLGMALTALAGPLSNVLLMLTAMALRLVILVFLPDWQYLILFFELTAILSAGLAVFNLFPIPPLDGSKILFALLPARWYARLLQYERYGMLLLAALLLTGVLDSPLELLRGRLIAFGNALMAPLASALIQLGG